MAREEGTIPRQRQAKASIGATATLAAGAGAVTAADRRRGGCIAGCHLGGTAARLGRHTQAAAGAAAVAAHPPRGAPEPKWRRLLPLLL